jgi:PRTRC genetic system protein C
MALVSTEVKRVFKFKKSGKDVVLDDPNPAFTAEEVLSFYSGAYPELTTSNVGTPTIKDDEAVYEFVTTVGTKG